MRSSLILLAFFAIILGSCDIFETRDADDPVQETTWNNFPTDPFKSMKNFLLVYNDKSLSVKYPQLFSNDFKFYFDTIDIAEFNCPESWNIDEEEEWLNNFYSEINSISLNLETIGSEPDEDYFEYLDSYEISRRYELSIDNLSDSLKYVGKSVIVLKPINGVWKISEWYDYRENNDLTWGRLKNEYLP